MPTCRIVIVKGVRKDMAATKHELDHWIREIGQGDRDALTELYHATSSGVFAYALSILKNQYDAEEVLQDCYLTIWNAARNYHSQGKPMAWILTIVRNLCFKQLQQQSKILPLEVAAHLQVPNSNHDDAIFLRYCMQQLSDEERQIVVLHAVAGCKFREIAGMLNQKSSTVLSKYHRAIQKLKRSIL